MKLRTKLNDEFVLDYNYAGGDIFVVHYCSCCQECWAFLDKTGLFACADRGHSKLDQTLTDVALLARAQTSLGEEIKDVYQQCTADRLGGCKIHD